MKRLSVIALALLAIGASRAGAQDVRYNFAKDAKSRTTRPISGSTSLRAPIWFIRS
jgi:hypothetical protein